MERPRNRVVWAPAARRDLLDIWRYFAEVASPELADGLLRDIAFAADRLSTDPQMFRVRMDLMPDLPGGLRSVPVHPYTIFYRVQPTVDGDDKGVQIIRVLHERRDFPPILPHDEPL